MRGSICIRNSVCLMRIFKDFLHLSDWRSCPVSWRHFCSPRGGVTSYFFGGEQRQIWTLSALSSVLFVCRQLCLVERQRIVSNSPTQLTVDGAACYFTLLSWCQRCLTVAPRGLLTNYYCIATGIVSRDTLISIVIGGWACACVFPPQSFVCIRSHLFFGFDNRFYFT